MVEEIAEGEKYLKVGDTVVSQFDQNWGGLAEYALVKSSNCARGPPARLSPAEAAGLSSSGASAVNISRYVKQGDRVLVIGGSGGVGTFLVQLARARGASFVAAVSTQVALMRELGVDRAIDYREEDVWTSAEFQEEGNRFDVVFDLVEKGWDRVTSEEGRKRPILKTGREGGRFVTTVWRRNGDGGGLFFSVFSVVLGASLHPYTADALDPSPEFRKFRPQPLHTSTAAVVCTVKALQNFRVRCRRRRTHRGLTDLPAANNRCFALNFVSCSATAGIMLASYLIQPPHSSMSYAVSLPAPPRCKGTSMREVV